MDRDFEKPAAATHASAPAIGYSIVCNLGGDRQITVQCFVGEDEPDAVVNGKIDRILGVVDRQKARYELEGLTEDLVKHEKTLAQFREDYERVDGEFEKAQAARNVELEALNKGMSEERDAGYAEHVAAGRRGEYKPKGHREASLKRIEASIAQQKEAIAKADAERIVAKQNLDISIKRYESEIERLKKEIARREKLLG